MFSFHRNSLNTSEKKTFRLHFTYASLDGIILGILILNEFVFLKSLGGSSFKIGVLFQFSVVVLIFLLFFNEYLRRVRNKRKMLRWTAILTRLPLVLMLFFPQSQEPVTETQHLLFLAVFFAFYMANPVLYPTINLLLKNNYRHEQFGKLYSWSASSAKMMMLVATFLFGFLLDHDPFAFRYVYPVAGLLSIYSIFMLAQIPFDTVPYEAAKKDFVSSIRDSLLNHWNILKNNQPYRDFEIAFMLYGFAFMSTFPVFTIFYEKQLGLSYSDVAFYKNVFNILSVIMIPFFGRFLGRTDPRRFAVLAFSVMSVYIFFTGLTQYLSFSSELFGIQIYYSLFIGVVFNGVFMAMIALLWYVGSAYFSRAEEAGDYQAVHSSLTGIRALFAPLLGVLFYETIGFTGTFIMAIAVLWAAVWVNMHSLRKSRLARVVASAEPG